MIVRSNRGCRFYGATGTEPAKKRRYMYFKHRETRTRVPSYPPRREEKKGLGEKGRAFVESEKKGLFFIPSDDSAANAGT